MWGARATRREALGLLDGEALGEKFGPLDGEALGEKFGLLCTKGTVSIRAKALRSSPV